MSRRHSAEKREINPDVWKLDWRVAYGTTWEDPVLDEASLLRVARVMNRVAGAPGLATLGIRCAR